ncbi:MAG: phosphatase PAP2 family protein [Verrucomicrobiales bacterium]|nr:phosphatase PAP2 family protein [Verrucomicrobiales bacterium]
MKHIKKEVLQAALIVSCGMCLTAQADSIVTDWNSITLQAIRVTKPGPPMVARALAVVHTSIFDAWAAYDATATGTRFNEYLRQPPEARTDYNKGVAISYAAYRSLIDLFPSEKATFDGVMISMGFDPNDTSKDRTTPIGIGNLTASAVLDFRHSDGSNQLGTPRYGDTTFYTPVNTVDEIKDPNRWQPLRFSNGTGGFVIPGYIAPHWGTVVPFALKAPDQYRPSAPAQYPRDPRYASQAEEIIRFSATLTDRTKMIAEYWADGPSSELPPGHWNLFAQVVSKRNKYGIDKDAKLFFALGNALLDASISVWEAKRYYDYCRPITAIRFLKKGKKILSWAGPNLGTQWINGEDWLPYQPPTFITPPFPEYTSGHSAFSAAGAEVLRSFTGSDKFAYGVTLKAGSSRTEPGTVPARDLVLYWNTFTEASDEAGISRRYGGIHFAQGDLESRDMGRRIGKQVWRKALRHFNEPKSDRRWMFRDWEDDGRGK